MNKIKLMTHVVIGYPTLEDTIKIVKTMASSGVDFVELQIPFSDPLADGPTIMRASEESLKHGTRVKDAFEIMKTLTKEVKIPLLFMAYYNTVFKYGVEQFCSDAAGAGAYGLIVPDITLEEEQEEHFIAHCKKNNLHNIQVVSPASTDERLKKNTAVASGFVYCTAHQGITGAQEKLDPSLVTYLQRVRKYFSLPIAVGFGISKKEHVKALTPYADIAIIGSALIDVIHGSDPREIETGIKVFLTGLSD